MTCMHDAGFVLVHCVLWDNRECSRATTCHLTHVYVFMTTSAHSCAEDDKTALHMPTAASGRSFIWPTNGQCINVLLACWYWCWSVKLNLELLQIILMETADWIREQIGVKCPEGGRLRKLTTSSPGTLSDLIDCYVAYIGPCCTLTNDITNGTTCHCKIGCGSLFAGQSCRFLTSHGSDSLGHTVKPTPFGVSWTKAWGAGLYHNKLYGNE